MNELPLSKFAPFSKEECHFQPEVSNKLKEIKVKCSNCIYFGGKLEQSYKEEYAYISYPFGTKELYKCNILKEYDQAVAEDSLCHFFTNLEEMDDPDEEEKSDDVVEMDLSQQINQLDFTNAEISTSINKLREKLINE